MPSGGRRAGAGRPKLPPATHLLRGTWRSSRHGKRPAMSAVVLEMPVPVGSWAPDAADLAALGAAGRALVAAVVARHELAPVEGCVLVEAGFAADALARLRAMDEPDAATQRLMQQWSKLFSTLLGQLHVEKG
jgi:hypothetical protein